MSHDEGHYWSHYIHALSPFDSRQAKQAAPDQNRIAVNPRFK